jgi:signal transduction histidine kinase
MKQLFTAALFVLFGISVFKAQNALPYPYSIKTDTARELDISKNYIQVLMDEKCPTSIDQLRQEKAMQAFQPLTQELLKKLSKKRCFWFLYRIQNATSTTVDYSRTNGSDRSDFYVFRGDKLLGHYVIGHLVPTAKKSGFKLANAFSLTLSPGEVVTIYQKTYNIFPIDFPNSFKIGLLHTAKLREEVLKQYEDYIPKSAYFIHFFLGMLGLAFLLNLLLFFQTRDKASLWFALFLLFSITSNAFADGDFSFTINAIRRFLGFFSFVAFPFFLLFLSSYFQIQKTSPRWSKGLSFFILLSFCYAIVKSVFQNSAIAITFGWFDAVVIAMILITTLICISKPSEQRSIFVKALSPFLILLVLLACLVPLIILKLIPNLFPALGYLDYIIYSCIIWAAIVFSAYLYNRYARQEKIILAEQLEKERLILEQERARIVLIEQQKLDLEQQVLKRTAELAQSLQTLQSTQAQLIQSEKLASLGELTAGIAHEIQNPLNFVNNFAEVSAEMLGEMKEEINAGNTAEVIAIADDLEQNLIKINHHGQRASSIVKGMLEHSRASTGVKEPTDLNALADEYLRLAYHGLRAKDSNFNAKLETRFDPDLPLVSVIPQDIGRVLLNLINNAFYAVHQRNTDVETLHTVQTLHATSLPYQPTVTVSTQKTGNQIIISVQDNGNGIPDNIKDKIFQPFFTNKPTGQGTGLGLSLSHDIVVKGHGGSLTFTSNENEGTTFILNIPFTTNLSQG